jgi:hypothetical protein
MFRTFSLKRVISETLFAKQIPVNHVQKYFNSRPLDIFKIVISKEHETVQEEQVGFKCVSYLKDCLPCTHLWWPLARWQTVLGEERTIRHRPGEANDFWANTCSFFLSFFLSTINSTYQL